MEDWANLLESQLKDYFAIINHGDYPKWQAAINALPEINPSVSTLNVDSIIIGNRADCSSAQYALIKRQLRALMPWRKGPFRLFGNVIDAEWRSNLKWDRFGIGLTTSLKDKLVLDIGCGNGYYGWRMLGEKARYVVGLDPTLLFLMQFAVFKKYLPVANIDIIPFGIQALPESPLNFDMVFSMGVIYHRRDPIQHLRQLHNCLRPGGELVLESLIIKSDILNILKPKGRYTKMNNVWAIPSLRRLIKWVEAVGFQNIQIIDVTRTTCAEQRRTDWMVFESLGDFLDKENSNKTIEGHPPPTRAILLAER